MSKLSRNSRLVAIMKIFLDKPNKIIGLGSFSGLFNTAKSTVSEDILIIREVLQKLEIGKIETISGASGGLRYIPSIGAANSRKFADELCKIINDGKRIIAGNFIYMTDIMYSPEIIEKAAVILSSCFNDTTVDNVITVETKGVPLAYAVAKNLGVQLVIARRRTQVTEGSTVTISYASGTDGRLSQMSLSKNSMKSGSKSIFIDDFMKGGGTAQGIKDLLHEFDSELVGIGVLVDNKVVEEKLVDDYVSIVEIRSVNKQSFIDIHPSKIFNKFQ